MRSFILFITILSCSCSSNSADVKASPEVERIFIQWNKLTLLSIDKKHDTQKDLKLKSYYQNRKEAFKAFLGFDTSKPIDTSSTRLTFLKKYIGSFTDKDIWIIEANVSGERIYIQNYVVIFKALDNVEVYKYQWEKDTKWILSDSTKQLSFKYEADIAKLVTEFGKGFNNDDVIITHIYNGNIQSSEYFLFATLKDNGLKSLLF